MDEGTKHVNTNPLQKANWLSKLFFWWINPLFKVGYKRNLEVEDMYNVVHDDSADYLSNRLQKEWDKELKKLNPETKGNPSLLRAMVRAFGKQYMLFGLITFVEEATKVVQPVLLGGLIRYFSPGSTMEPWEAYMYAAGVSFCAMFLAIFHHPYFFGVQRIGMWLRIASCSLIYKKSLRLSHSSLGKTTTGQIVNLMSNDVNRFDQAVIFLHFLWIGPLEAIAALVILWYMLGPACLAGYAVLVLLIPVQGWMGKLFAKLRRKTAVQTDERVRIMSEIISGMRVIKMYCWEKPFGELIRRVRKS
ncbi:multidrug resistance-associated protein 4-like isoform X4 [Lingula anatina]|uniref:Multidrug resistance-associated protein 4-like isoform X4 n=1 Tax=Lingula anatina TaxID=7574 RepID=A0A2R2MSS8_LINAN|nr:multidrug resistance-associated protein 4-like isoform X4 [Lingula anatina]|eukprot:XP_023933062.1 multidrug resistance-associated protein 4-like isoform X4 [Lingula anatina]